MAFGNSFNDEERCVLAGYDNGDVKLFDLRMNQVRVRQQHNLLDLHMNQVHAASVLAATERAGLRRTRLSGRGSSCGRCGAAAAAVVLRVRVRCHV